MAQIAVASRPRLLAGRVTGSISLDGQVREPDWFAADSIDGLTEVEPVAGGTPASRTTVRFLMSNTDLYVAIEAHNPPGVPITTFSKARDSEIDEEDFVAIVLDTFLDGRSGYTFAVNPSGARLDALVADQGEGYNTDWDAIWDVATARTATGWSAEFRIPIRSLIFKPGLTEWGLNIGRQVRATQEVSRWAGASPDFELSQVSRSGLLTEVPPFSLGLGLSVRPTLAVGGERESPEDSFGGSLEPSLDATQRIGGNLLGSLTVNTDFAETEVDTRRTNLTRFPLFFPEKRTFFLEGADIFDFGLGTGTDVLAFHSRRIGLYEGREVPLIAGGKLNGRTAGNNVGALVTWTDDVTDLVPETAMAVARVTRNVLAESSVGLIGTAGDPDGRSGSWLAGADFTYNTSRLGGDKNFLVGVWGLVTDREDLSGDRTAIGGKVDYPNDLWDVAFTWRRVGEGFDPSLGFVPRPGVYVASLGGRYAPRPRKWGIRQVFPSLRGTVAADLDWQWESWRVAITPVNLQMESGDGFEIEVTPQGERLPEPFEIEDGIVLPPGEYGFTRVSTELGFASKRPLSGDITWSFGGFYSGTLHEVEVDALWKPSPFINFQGTVEWFDAVLNQGGFTTTLVGARVQVNVSPRLQFSTYWQYDTESRIVGSNSRLRWSPTPLADVFLVYNHNVLDDTDGLAFQSNDVRLKAQYTLRY